MKIVILDPRSTDPTWAPVDSTITIDVADDVTDEDVVDIIHERYRRTHAISLTREEACLLRLWMDEHGYGQQPNETIEEWRTRTAPIAYAYSSILSICDLANPKWEDQ